MLQWVISLCTHMNLSSNTSAILISLVRFHPDSSIPGTISRTIILEPQNLPGTPVYDVHFSNRRETSRRNNGFPISHNLQRQFNSNFKIIKRRYFSCWTIFWSYSKWRCKMKVLLHRFFWYMLIFRLFSLHRKHQVIYWRMDVKLVSLIHLSTI